MGKKKTSSVPTISSGNKKAIRKARHEKRLAKFAAKKGTDKEYKYKKNPYQYGTEEWVEEETSRKAKRDPHRFHDEYSLRESVLKKASNYVEKIEKDRIERTRQRRKALEVAE